MLENGRTEERMYGNVYALFFPEIWRKVTRNDVMCKTILHNQQPRSLARLLTSSALIDPTLLDLALQT